MTDNPCTQPNTWSPAFRTCVRSLGHEGSHRDQIGGRWYTGQELEREYGQVSGSAHTGPGTLAPLTPQALATPHPPPPTSREQELEAQLDQERQAHTLTKWALKRAMALLERLGYQEGAQDE